MNKKIVCLVFTCIFLIASIVVCADEVFADNTPILDFDVEVNLEESDKEALQFPGTTPRPDGNAFLFETITEEAVAISTEAYNNFMTFDPDMFLYSDEGLKIYDYWGVMTDSELNYVKEMALEITEGSTTADEKIWAVAEYVSLNVCYDYDYITHGTKTEEEVYVSAYDVLVNESSICHGYSLSCMALLQSLDIPCVFVRSPNHAWNMAYNGERWILFDTTWIGSGSLEYGVLNKSDRLYLEWYDFDINKANSDYNHTIEMLDLMIYDRKLTKFPKYTKVESFVIPDEVVAIDDEVFWGCTSLKNITIGENVTSIGNYAFCQCSSLESIIVPDSVVYMGDYAFFQCDDLEYVKLGKNVNGIGYAAFCYCDSLDKINIPESVAYIGFSAFDGCKELKDIIIPDSVNSIAKQAFLECESLKNVEIGNGVESIDDLAFYKCSELEKLIIGDGVSSIGTGAFVYCNKIKDIVIGDGVDGLGYWDFGECLESVVIGDGVTAIGDYAFSGCTNLKNVDMGNGVRSIGYAAFYKCNSLAGIKISDSVKSIGEFAFSECAALADVSMGKNLESIGYAAFYVCGKLETVRLCHKLKNVDYAAFNGTKIKNVYYTGNGDDWNSIVFGEYNAELTSANRSYVPNTSMELLENTFKIECKNIPQSGYNIFICSYADGRIKNAYVRTVKEITDEVFTLSDGVDTVKVFVLGCDGSLVPVTAGEILEM